MTNHTVRGWKVSVKISVSGVSLPSLWLPFSLLSSPPSSSPLLAWVSGVSGGKGERWKRKRERAEGEKRLTQMLLLEPSTPTQHDSIPSNQNHIRSLGCQLHLSKSSPKINLTLPLTVWPSSGACIATISLFLKPPMRSFRILVMEKLPFLRN